MNEMHLRIRRKTLKENEALDEITGHKFVEVNGVLTEYKYCPLCKQWYVLEDFGSGCSCYCANCRRKKQRGYKEKRRERNGYVARETKKRVAPSIMEGDRLNINMDSLLDNLNAIYDEYVSIKKRLSVWESDISKLPIKDIERILREGKYPIRVLFDAIRERDERYTFFAVDKTTGLATPLVKDSVIKTDGK